MNSSKKMVFTALGLAIMATFGCANNEVVKKEEPVAATMKKPPVEAVKPAATQPAATKADQMKPMETTGAKASVTSAAFEAVYFDFDKADLSNTARAVLTKNADLFKANPNEKIRIEGNCDERGSAEYNLALGERRAKSAQQYLTTLGVPAGRLSVISYGKERPAVQGNNEAAWAKNRRDDFVVQK